MFRQTGADAPDRAAAAERDQGSAPSLLAFQSRWWWVVYVAAASVIGCLCLVAFGPVMGDSARYVAIARNLAAGHGFSSASAAPYSPELFRAPLYPLLLAAILKSGLGLYAVPAFQLALYIASIAIVRRAAFMIHGDPFAAQLAGLILAVHAPIIRWVVQICTEPLMLFFFSATALLLVRHLQEPRWGTAVTLGALVGAMFLTRTDYVLLVGVVPVVVAVRHHAGRTLRQTIAMTAIVAVLAGAWMTRNTFVVPGSPRPFGAAGGMALWVRSVEVVERDLCRRDRIVQTNPHIRAMHDQPDPQISAAADATLTREALAVLSRHVGAWAIDSAYKLMFRGWVERYQKGVPAVVLWGAALWSASLLFLAYFGLASLWRRGHAVRTLLLLVLAVAPVHAALITEARYTTPLRPVLLIFAAWALARFLRRWHRHLGPLGRWIGRLTQEEAGLAR